MTKLSPQYQAWRARMAEKYPERYSYTDSVNREVVADFLAGAEAEHEAAKLVGRIEALTEAEDTCDYRSGPWIAKVLRDAQARLDALLAGGEGRGGEG